MQHLKDTSKKILKTYELAAEADVILKQRRKKQHTEKLDGFL